MTAPDPTARRVRSLASPLFAITSLVAIGIPSGLFAQGASMTAPAIIADAGGTVSGTILLDNPFVAQGLSIALCHDPAAATAESIVLGTDLATTNAGSPPAFSQTDVWPNGVSAGVIIDFLGFETLEPGTELEVFTITYTVAPTATGSNPLTFCSVGNPPVITSLIVNGVQEPVAEIDGEILVGPPPEAFERGDCNDDGTRNIADAVTLLSGLFPVTPVSIPCVDACEVNDDGSWNIADAIFLLTVLFGGGVLPEPVECGADPTPGDPFDCASSLGC